MLVQKRARWGSDLMRSRSRSWFGRLARGALLAAAAGTAAGCGRPEPGAPSGTEASAAASPALPRGADGRPKLDGIWQALADASWDIRPHPAAHPALASLGAAGAIPPGLGIVEGNEIPYQPWAADKQRENFANRLALDPEVKCYLP